MTKLNYEATMQTLKKTILLTSAFMSVLLNVQQTLAQDLAHQEIRWDWHMIETNKIAFPKTFLFGTGISEWQASGTTHCPHSNWARYEKRTAFDWIKSITHFGKSTNSNDFTYDMVDDAYKCGAAANHWNKLKEDTQLMKNLGVNAARFSLSWSEIEPEEGHFNTDVIKHYHEEIDTLIANGIIPMITLVHFDVPTWFEDKGGFEVTENNEYFIRFCTTMFAEFHDKVTLWITINEPGVLAFQTYFRGVYPPAKRDMGLMAEVTKNLMLAHVAAYYAMKNMPDGDKAMIGLVHDIVQYEPYHPGNTLELWVTNFINHIFHESITEFLITKKFHFYCPPLVQPFFGMVPTTADTYFELDDITEPILDFIGLNYYSHVLWSWTNPTWSSYRPDEIPTDMPYAVYPEGLYRAIDTASRMGVPIYITENGLADGKDDRREEFLKRYLYVVSKALQDGYDVRGYFYWSLYDNCEWDMHLDGNPKQYGLYTTDFKTFEHTLRPSAQYYINSIDAWKKSHNNEVPPLLKTQPSAGTK